MRFSVRRILVPTDFSEPSSYALEMAIELGRRFGAELVLFHAHEMPAYVFPDGVMPVTPDVLSDLQTAVDGELERLAARVRAAGLRVSRRSAIGVHDLEICRAAEEVDADLIIMGTHGRTGLRHALIGSVAEKVVRKAPCAVLTVRPEAAAHYETLPAP